MSEVEYTLAHCAAYRIGEGERPWVLLVKTVDGEVDYIEVKEDPVIKFYIGMAKDSSDEEQHRIVKEGYPVDKANLDMLVNNTHY